MDKSGIIYPKPTQNFGLSDNRQFATGPFEKKLAKHSQTSEDISSEVNLQNKSRGLHFKSATFWIHENYSDNFVGHSQRLVSKEENIRV